MAIDPFRGYRGFVNAYLAAPPGGIVEVPWGMPMHLVHDLALEKQRRLDRLRPPYADWMAN